MTVGIVVIFALVYFGMVLGGLPYLQLDRTGVALLGAIALIGIEAVSLEQAAEAVHLPTLILLFAFMVMSAQLRLGGFYEWVVAKLVAGAPSPPVLLGGVTVASGGLSAVFSNDIVCLAAAPVLIAACRRRKLDPVPFLLGLACAANIGSAATLIGNPQNILIGQTLRLSFGGYFAEAVLPVALGLFVSWAVIAWQSRGKWASADGSSEPAASAPAARSEAVSLDRWQTTKGLAVASAVVAAFLFTPLAREHIALTAAGLLLMSRKLHSRRMLGLVDWELLVLFIGLFVVNHALQLTSVIPQTVAWFAASGVHLGEPATLFAATFVLSNVVSNVPAVMLLLPLAEHPLAGPLLALVSTLAGNLLIVGSIANIIVVQAAARQNIHITWRSHARAGIPVTLATLGIVAGYLWARL
jgi:Na+/H+ antiporter NhaD/arsenite permease-like protein